MGIEKPLAVQLAGQVLRRGNDGEEQGGRGIAKEGHGQIDSLMDQYLANLPQVQQIINFIYESDDYSKFFI